MSLQIGFWLSSIRRLSAVGMGMVVCLTIGVASGVEPADTAITAADVADSSAAAPDDAGDGGRITDVVVTSQRREEHIQKVSTTVSAVSGNEVQDLDLGSSAANVTFLVAATSAGETAPTRPRWWIRGVGTGAQGFDVQSPVGVYFDDVYYSNVNATGQPIYDLERVEVLEGPRARYGERTPRAEPSTSSRRSRPSPAAAT